MTKLPRLSVNRLDITSKRSDVVLTGKKRRRGTLTPKDKIPIIQIDFILRIH